ncbi:MAG: hypothetical protein WAV50_00105 [Minisyncoccia bacterium]
MNKQTVMTLIRWEQTENRLRYSLEVITVKSFFTRAYLAYYGGTDSGSNVQIQSDEVKFWRHGRIPIYVALFIKGVLYPHRLKSDRRSAGVRKKTL